MLTIPNYDIKVYSNPLKLSKPKALDLVKSPEKYSRIKLWTRFINTISSSNTKIFK